MRRRAFCRAGIATLASPLLGGIVRAELAAISESKTGDHGFVVHAVRSEFQVGTTHIHVRVPANSSGRLRVLYILPVEAHDEQRWGDARAEIARLNIADRYNAICVFPTFSHLPWFVDHPNDPRIQQESYFIHVVVPFVERHYPAQVASSARLLLGFSKSGWGAWTLLLRHPDLFARAAAWDAPMTMEFPRYGIGPIVGSAENFERYRVVTLLRQRGRSLGGEPRLALTGFDFYRGQIQGVRRLLQELKLPHFYRDGPQRRHHWNSGWMAELAQWLMR